MSNILDVSDLGLAISKIDLLSPKISSVSTQFHLNYRYKHKNSENFLYQYLKKLDQKTKSLFFSRKTRNIQLVLKKLRNLETLNTLNFSFITSNFKTKLLSMKNLKHLVITSSKIKFQVFSACKNIPNLETLTVIDDFNPGQTYIFGNYMQQQPNYNAELEKPQTLITVFKDFKFLRSLSLNILWKGIKLRELNQISSSLTNIKTLELRTGEIIIDNDFMTDLSDLLAHLAETRRALIIKSRSFDFEISSKKAHFHEKGFKIQQGGGGLFAIQNDPQPLNFANLVKQFLENLKAHNELEEIDLYNTCAISGSDCFEQLAKIIENNHKLKFICYNLVYKGTLPQNSESFIDSVCKLKNLETLILGLPNSKPEEYEKLLCNLNKSVKFLKIKTNSELLVIKDDDSKFQDSNVLLSLIDFSPLSAPFLLMHQNKREIPIPKKFSKCEIKLVPLQVSLKNLDIIKNFLKNWKTPQTIKFKFNQKCITWKQLKLEDFAKYINTPNNIIISLDLGVFGALFRNEYFPNNQDLAIIDENFEYISKLYRFYESKYGGNFKLEIKRWHFKASLSQKNMDINGFMRNILKQTNPQIQKKKRSYMPGTLSEKLRVFFEPMFNGLCGIFENLYIFDNDPSVIYMSNHLRHFKNLKFLLIDNPINNSGTQNSYLTLNIVDSLLELQNLEQIRITEERDPLKPKIISKWLSFINRKNLKKVFVKYPNFMFNLNKSPGSEYKEIDSKFCEVEKAENFEETEEEIIEAEIFTSIFSLREAYGPDFLCCFQGKNITIRLEDQESKNYLHYHPNYEKKIQTINKVRTSIFDQPQPNNQDNKQSDQIAEKTPVILDSKKAFDVFRGFWRKYNFIGLRMFPEKDENYKEIFDLIQNSKIKYVTLNLSRLEKKPDRREVFELLQTLFQNGVKIQSFIADGIIRHTNSKDKSLLFSTMFWIGDEKELDFINEKYLKMLLDDSQIELSITGIDSGQFTDNIFKACTLLIDSKSKPEIKFLGLKFPTNSKMTTYGLSHLLNLDIGPKCILFNFKIEGLLNFNGCIGNPPHESFPYDPPSLVLRYQLPKQ